MAYSGGQQVFSPYAAMGNSPGMMIDPNGEMTKYAEPVQDGDYAVHGGMDAVAVRQFMANGAHGMFGKLLMLGMNTILTAANGGGGNSIAIDGNNVYTTGSAAQELFAALFKSDDLSESQTANTASGNNYNSGSISPVENVQPNDGGGGGGSESGWSPLYKSTLLGYVRTTRCSDCSEGQLQNKTGHYFEDLFDDYLKRNYSTLNNFKISEFEPGKFQGGLDYTVPDYLGFRVSTDGRRVEVALHNYYEIESFVELKATKNPLGLGSFSGQLSVQILAAKAANVGEIVFVTTHGVKLTQPLLNFARDNNVTITQYWTQYRFVGSQMQINLQRVNYKK